MSENNQGRQGHGGFSRPHPGGQPRAGQGSRSFGEQGTAGQGNQGRHGMVGGGQQGNGVSGGNTRDNGHQYMAGGGDHGSIIQQEVSKLLTWRMGVQINLQEKQARVQLLRKITKEQDVEIRQLDQDMNKLKDGLELSQGLDRKVGSLTRQGETQNAFKSHLVKKLGSLEENKSQEFDEFKNVECDLLKLTEELNSMTLSYKDKEQSLRNDIQAARQERDTSIQTQSLSLNQLKEAKERQNDETHELNLNLENEKTKLETSQINLKTSEQNIENLHQEFNNVKAQKKDNEDQRCVELDSLNSKMNQLNELIQKKQQDMDTIDTESRSVEEDIENMKRNVLSNEEEKMSMEKQISRLTARNIAVQDEIKNVELEMKEEESSVEQLKIKQTEVDRLKAEYTESNEKLINVETENLKYQEDIKDLKSRKREEFRLNTEVLDLEKQIYEEEETFRVKLQYAEANIQKVKREQDQRGEYNQEEIQILQEELDVLTGRFQQLEAEVSAIKNNTAQILQESENSVVEMQLLQKKFEELKTREASIEEEIVKARANQEATQEQKDAKLAERKQQVEVLKHKEKDAMTIVDALNQENDQLEGELADLLATLQSACYSSKLKSSTNTKRKMENDLADLDKQIININQNIQDLQGKMEDATLSREQRGADKTGLTAKIEAAKQEYEALESREADCKKLEAEIEKCRLQQNCVDNVSDVEAKKARLADKKAKLVTLQATDSQTSARCQLEINALNATIARTIKSLDVELQDTKAEMEKVEIQVKDLEADKDQRMKRNQELTNKVKQLKAKDKM